MPKREPQENQIAESPNPLSHEFYKLISSESGLAVEVVSYIYDAG
jgi:hypothetical protein